MLLNGGIVTISTNTGVGTKSMWHDLGLLSKEYPRILFCKHVSMGIEKQTIYRVNTKFNVIERNLMYLQKIVTKEAGTKINGRLLYSIHNEHEIEAAKAHAEKLGLKFLLGQACVIVIITGF